MNKITLILFLIISSVTVNVASQCFIAKENDQILAKEGDCNERFSPASSFKIVLSLIGFDFGILIDEMHPVWCFKDGYADFRDEWKQDQTPKSWMKESCVWYSQVLTTQLGMENFQGYVTKFDYGNKDLSGDKEKNNSLINAWLSSSLEISNLEQVTFLEKMLTGKLPVSAHAIEMTKNILFVEELKDGWKLYGKTGMGFLLDSCKTKIPNRYHGWFVGWIEKGDRKIIFSNLMKDDKEEETFASLRAKADAKKRLIRIIDQLK